MKRLCLSGLTLGTALLGISAAQASPDFTVTIVGEKQGTFGAPSSISSGHTAPIKGLKYDYAVTTPRDSASGLPTGKAQHTPVTFEKEWDAATPQIFEALVTNEILKTVTFQFFKTEPDGKIIATFRVKLTNATISALHQHGSDQSTLNAFDEKPLEDVSLTFQKIEITDTATGGTAADDWEATAGLPEPAHSLRKQLASRLVH